ncbi:EAL domain-containing protein, partial [Escherichia coli]|uniref:EAL domain-containing protein n=4 Tax=Gammaproteobacteria TaxID=1236 RepID=UPI001EDA6689
LYQWSQHEHSAHWTVSVNISVQQFRQSDFEDNVMQIIRETEANPHRLRLELTESMFYRDMHSSIQKMKKLIEIGVRFSMDDFGTGYSSLNYLKLLPLDQLKI